MGFIDKLFAPSPNKSFAKHATLIDKINDLETEYKKKNDAQLTKSTDIFRERIAKGESLDDLLPEAFAAVKEAARRTISQVHFDVQLIGGIILHQGKIAEMRTGEGKTLVATLPLYLNALLGKGAHLVTVNDFLAKFHGQWMGHIYNALGMTTGIIGHESSWVYSHQAHKTDDETWAHLTPVSRRQSYAADITYGTNNEFGFDYLRDNMAPRKTDMAQRELNYAIVDEVDSILIDEARTPLIISAPARESTSLYQKFAGLVKQLKAEDYLLDEKERSVSLSDNGIKKMEAWLGIGNLYDSSNVELIHHSEEALKAEVLFKRDKDYVVKDDEIIIVDEFTGRLMHGRRYSEGLHQAIEAKENVEVKRESETLATVSFQNLFRLYDKLSGMTGTASTETEEFWKIYGLEVDIIPTNRPMIRKDLNDRIYKNEEAKYTAVVQEIKERNEKGQPILVGTISIEKNEKLSKSLKKEGIKHSLLNAKNHENEARLIAQAGRIGGVTIATNIAGRGVDIILGGVAPEPSQVPRSKSQNNDKTEGEEVGLEVLARDNRTIDEWQKEHERIIELGGLFVIGTERHESRRIDNQLRGRAGRQGDPGGSIFFVSMDDDLMRIFGGERLKGMMDRLGLPDNMAIEHKIVSRSIEQAQKKVEGHNFDIRKHLVEYDDVMNKHREAIYRKRRLILDGKGKDGADITDLHDEIISMFNDEELPAYQEKIKRYGIDMMKQAEQQIYLRVIDQMWVEHLNSMEELRTGIGLRGYGQKDPLVEYKQESYLMFNRLLDAIEAQLIDILLKIEAIQTAPAPSPTPAVIIEQGAEEEPSGEVIKEEIASQNMDNNISLTVRKKGQVVEQTGGVNSAVAKVGRNDLCPCGSGKKYKKCHGK